MSRDFSKDLANYLSLGTNQINPLLSGASAITAHLWVNNDSLSGGAIDNRLLEIQITTAKTSGLLLLIEGTTSLLRVYGRSDPTDSSQSRPSNSTISITSWFALGGVLDFGADTITPYVNGIAENGGAATFNSTTHSPGTPNSGDAIGAGISPADISTNQIDGKIAEVGLWKAGLTANEMAALSRGISPLRVRRESLVCYWPLWGLHSPEIELVNNKVGTITGSIPLANHAPVTTFTPKSFTAVENLNLSLSADFNLLPLLGVGR